MYKGCYKQMVKYEIRCLCLKLCGNKFIILQAIFDKEVVPTIVIDAQCVYTNIHM